MWYATETENTSDLSMGLDKTTLMRTFNTHFFEFMDDVIGIFPENLEIVSARNTFETFRKANPTAIVKVWYKYIFLKYNDMIQMGDLSYFLEKNYVDDLTNVKNPNRVLEVIDGLRAPLREMGETNKQHTLKYIQNLCRLSNMYAEAGGAI
jgi:hypothetical protein